MSTSVDANDTFASDHGMSNVDVVHRFYEAFARKDAEAMAACYADNVHFSDAAFENLNGSEAGDMWRMLCGRSTDLVVVASDIRADGNDKVLAHWEATYSFGPQQRKVLNRIDATFRFNGAGLIVDHADVFDFWTWSRQALGLPGLLLGWSPMLKKTVRARALAGLVDFRARR